MAETEPALPHVERGNEGAFVYVCARIIRFSNGTEAWVPFATASSDSDAKAKVSLDAGRIEQIKEEFAGAWKFLDIVSITHGACAMRAPDAKIALPGNFRLS